MSDITDAHKRPEDDRGVIIEDDVWVGTWAVILHGATIGRGSILGAGAVVTKSVPAYAIVGGAPARVLKWRWSIDEIIAREETLYPPERRLRAEQFQTRITGQ
jgi:acetyltransferase-like isoleucine patch superfamily enzyme